MCIQGSQCATHTEHEILEHAVCSGVSVAQLHRYYIIEEGKQARHLDTNDWVCSICWLSAVQLSTKYICCLVFQTAESFRLRSSTTVGHGLRLDRADVLALGSVCALCCGGRPARDGAFFAVLDVTAPLLATARVRADAPLRTRDSPRRAAARVGQGEARVAKYIAESLIFGKSV